MSSIQVPIAKRRGSHAAHLLALLAGATMLAGCVTTNQDVVVGPTPSDYRQRHPTVIKEEPRTVELFIGSKRGTLTPAQRADVFAFAQEWRREASGGVLIDLPAGTRQRTGRRRRHARSYTQSSPAPVCRRMASPCGPITRAIRSSSPRCASAIHGSLPRPAPAGYGPTIWARPMAASTWENREYWNLGCASQHNLAAMVENPHDLVQPRGETPIYAGRRTTVLGKYHRGESTAAINPDAGKGKISNVGQ